MTYFYILNLMGAFCLCFWLWDIWQVNQLESYTPTLYSMRYRKPILKYAQHMFQPEILFGKGGIELIISPKLLICLMLWFVMLIGIFISNMPLWVKGCFIGLSLVSPLLLIEYKISDVRRHIDQNFLGFMHAMHAGLLQSEDVISALRYTELTVKSIYYKRLIGRFNRVIQCGLSPEAAFEQLGKGAYHAYFEYVILNIQQVFERRGDVIGVIEKLQLEYSAIQIELNKRKIELRQERHIVIACLCFFLGVCLKVRNDYNYIWQFYVSHHMERYIVLAIICAVIITVFMLMKGDRLNY